MSEMYMAKRVVDSTAPWGRPAGVFLGVDDASFNRTVKERPTRNARIRRISLCRNLSLTGCKCRRVSYFMCKCGSSSRCWCDFRRNRYTGFIDDSSVLITGLVLAVYGCYR